MNLYSTEKNSRKRLELRVLETKNLVGKYADNADLQLDTRNKIHIESRRKHASLGR